ncbi:GPR1/FUN34/yaaH family-domain-containing protein [Aspergillus spectabilis]
MAAIKNQLEQGAVPSSVSNVCPQGTKFYLLKVGWLECDEGFVGRDGNTSLKSDGKNSFGLILWETGCGRDYHEVWGPAVSNVFARGQYGPRHELRATVEATGNKFEDIKKVIIGHLHLDHAGGLDEFISGKDVEIWVHDKELHSAFCSVATGADAGVYLLLLLLLLLLLHKSFHFCLPVSIKLASSTETKDHVDKVPMPTHGPNLNHLERLYTAEGHINNRSQPGLPTMHHLFANPSPLGLLSFATGIFLVSALGLHARGVTSPNVLIGVLTFFGTLCQFAAGIKEFFTGNTVRFLPFNLSYHFYSPAQSANILKFPVPQTLSCSYTAFNFSNSMIYVPGTGIMAAYTDPATGTVTAELGEAVSIYLCAWFILNVVYKNAAIRAS